MAMDKWITFTWKQSTIQHTFKPTKVHKIPIYNYSIGFLSLEFFSYTPDALCNKI